MTTFTDVCTDISELAHGPGTIRHAFASAHLTGLFCCGQPAPELGAPPAVEDARFRAEDWAAAFTSQKSEFEYWLDEVEGEVPQALRGTLFRNGPANFGARARGSCIFGTLQRSGMLLL